MSEPAEEAVVAVRAAREGPEEELQRVFGLGPGAARILAEHGYTTADALHRLDEGALEDMGLDPADIARIRAASEARTAEPPPMASMNPAPEGPGAPEAGDRILDRWADSVRKSERPKRHKVPVGGGNSEEVLRKWVQGDDKALETWIQASEDARPIPAAPMGERPMRASETGTGPSTFTAPALIPEQIREREETVLRWLTELLDRVKTDQFDSQSLLAEMQELHRQVYEERSRHKQLEDELEHVKRGSVAVIKYVRAREAKTREQAIQAKEAELAELRLKLLAAGDVADGVSPNAEFAPHHPTPATDATGGPHVPEATVRDVERRVRTEYEEREHAFIERETELRRRIVQLEGDIRNLRADVDARAGRQGLVDRPAEAIPAAVALEMKALEGRERDLVLRENELRTKFEEIRLNAEEIERKRVPLEDKEHELGQWEQQLMTMKQALEVETRKLEASRREAETARESGVTAAERQKLIDLQNTLLHKEAEQKAREAFINQRMEELDALQRKQAMGEIEEITPAAVSEIASKKVKSGVRRLDDLLFGGFPPGSQLLLNGPAHTGKDVLARFFVAEGLKQGIPAIWVGTDKTYLQIREEMTALLPNYPEFEQKGMTRYIDLYARSLGVTQAEPGVRLLASSDKSVLEQLTQTVNNYSQEFKERFPTYRLIFESVSTVTAYLDTTAMFRFLQPFAGRRKMDGAAAYYLLETGMHTESDLQSLEHMMDGSINLKVEQLKTFLSVRGIAETQSRAWIGYTFSKKAFSLGSFSLDHIR
jgi:KaiC/GvpD/RAD55 family RecA-like ATPase